MADLCLFQRNRHLYAGKNRILHSYMPGFTRSRADADQNWAETTLAEQGVRMLA